MKTLAQDDVLRLVRAEVDANQPPGYRLQVVPDGVELRYDRWNIVVVPDRDDVKTYDYSARLSELEERIETKHGVKVLLLPLLVPTDD